MHSIRQATSNDVDTIAAILVEAALWLEDQGMTMWRAS